MAKLLPAAALAKYTRRARVRHSRPAWTKIAPVAIVTLALFLAWRYTPLADVITAQHVRTWARAIRGVSWSPLVVMAAYTPAAFVMFPRPLITLLAVIAFGPWLGFVTAMTGIMLAATVAYYVGRALPEDTLREVAGEKFDQTSKALRGHGIAAGFAVSIAPVSPFPVVGMLAGAARLKLWQYLLGTALGMAPGTIATTLFADQLANALQDPSEINYWVIAAIVIVSVALIVIVRRWLVKSGKRR